MKCSEELSELARVLLKPKRVNKTVRFVDELSVWLEEEGFVNDRGAKNPKYDEPYTLDFGKKNCKYRWQVEVNWDKRLSWSSPVEVLVMNCEHEAYSEAPYLGWQNQYPVNHFKKPFTKTMFNELCNQYGM